MTPPFYFDYNDWSFYSFSVDNADSRFFNSVSCCFHVDVTDKGFITNSYHVDVREDFVSFMSNLFSEIASSISFILLIEA